MMPRPEYKFYSYNSEGWNGSWYGCQERIDSTIYVTDFFKLPSDFPMNLERYCYKYSQSHQRSYSVLDVDKNTVTTVVCSTVNPSVHTDVYDPQF